MHIFQHESQGSIQEQKSGSASQEDEGIHWTYIYNRDYAARRDTMTGVKHMACDFLDPRTHS